MTDSTQPDHIVDMHEMVTDTNQAITIRGYEIKETRWKHIA